jgi:Transglycosylase SLT domain
MPFPRALSTTGAAAFLTFVLVHESRASRDGAGLCLAAAKTAAAATGVPEDVLVALSIVETGRDNRPWPWTVNLGGEGHWLDSSEEAERLVSQALDAGLTNIDVGCFQLNYRWHGDAFLSIADMLDPDQNARYAAAYLKQQYDETQDWSLAAAAYHSATPEHAARYQARFDATWNGFAAVDPAFAGPPAEDRLNRFPLLTSGLAGSRGSLVPATLGGPRLIGGS